MCLNPLYKDRVEECKRPCWVVLKKLTNEEIERYTNRPVPSDGSNLLGCMMKYDGEDSKSYRNYYDDESGYEKRISRKASRMQKFEEYKKNRQNFLSKKRRWSSEIDDAGSSNDDYRPPDSHSKERRRRKKKLSYEDDVDWSPNLDREINIHSKYTTLRNKKSGKLRITTRRRRIETDSDSDSNFDYETYMYDYEDDDFEKQESLPNSNMHENVNDTDAKAIYDPTAVEKPPTSKKTVKAKKPKAKESKIVNTTQNSMIDNDVLSRIIQEMEDYNIKHGKGSKVVKSIFNGGLEKIKTPNIEPKSNTQKKKRTGIKITKNILPPSVCTVQNLLSKMVNTVCSTEAKRLKQVENRKMKNCKWCKVQFKPENDDILCVICKDTVDIPSVTTKKKAKKLIPTATKGKNSQSKMKKKVFKHLPKYEKQMLTYTDKCTVDKGYNHLKTFDSSKKSNNSEEIYGDDLTSVTSMKENSKKKVKTKKNKIESKKSDTVDNKSNSTIPKLKIKKKVTKSNTDKETNSVKQIKCSNPKQTNIQAEGKNQNNVAIKTVNKGLYLMTFPDLDKELEIPQSRDSVMPLSTPTLKQTLNFNTPSVSSSISSINSESSVINSQVFNGMPPNTRTQPLNSNQYGPIIRPPAPAVVVANYTAPNMNGDYVLSGVFYRNQLGQASAINRSIPPSSPINSNSLSMPLIGESSIMNQNVPTNMYQDQYLNLPPNSNMTNLLNDNNIKTSVSNNIIVRNVQAHSSVSKPVQNQFYLPNQPLINNSNLPVESDISRFINHCDLQITPRTIANTVNTPPNVYNSLSFGGISNTSLAQAITGLVNNCDLQIAPTENPQFSNNLSNELNYTSANDINSLINQYELQSTPSSNASQVLSTEPFHIQNSNSDQLNANNPFSLNSKENITESNSKTGNVNTKDSKEEKKSEETYFSMKHLDPQLKKTLKEISAFASLSVIDLDINPRKHLMLQIKKNDELIEELSKDKEKNSENLEKALDDQEMYKLIKKWFKRFGSFKRLSENFLNKEDEIPLKTPLEIKKEHIEEEENEMSSCQFASQQCEQQSIVNELHSGISVKMVELNPNQTTSDSLTNHIANLETQVDSIADQLRSAGVDCTIPIPGITAMSSSNSNVPVNLPRNDLLLDSRETPSRGSGPRTPARPESAASHIEDNFLSPAQIKKEKFESASSPFSQCAYTGNISNTAHLASTSTAQEIPPISPLGTLSSLLSPTLSQVLSQTTMSPPVSMQSIMPQTVVHHNAAFRNTSVITRQGAAPNVSIIPNIPYSNAAQSQPNISIRTIPQNITNSNYTNVVSSYNNSQIQNTVNYQNQVPPNRTAPFNTSPNYSKVLMNIASKPSTQPMNSVVSSNNSNIVIRSGQQTNQFYMQQPQQQQPQQQQPFTNQVYNVQQVYLPNTPILQQQLNSTPAASTQSPNQYIIRQTPNTVATTLAGGAVLLNSSSLPNNTVQPNNAYSVSNFPQNLPSLDNVTVQQVSSPNNQIPPGAAAAFLMKNNKNPLENEVDMFCALCNKVATLRCKQCAKVAYCDSSCAKTYWHSKHKMECRPVSGPM